MAGDNARVIGIDMFIDKEQLDLLTVEKTYYIVPDKNGDKGYVLLREALASTKTAGIAKVIISTKEYVAAVFAYEKALVLCLLYYDSEMRKLSELKIPEKEISAYKINKREIEIANQLIKSMKSKWKPEKYVDEYQDALHEWVEESINHIPHTKKKSRSRPTTTNVISFVDLLKKSLAQKEKSKTSHKAHSPVHKSKAAHNGRYSAKH